MNKDKLEKLKLVKDKERIAKRYRDGDKLEWIDFEDEEDEFLSIWPCNPRYEKAVETFLASVNQDARQHIEASFDTSYGSQNALYHACMYEFKYVQYFKKGHRDFSYLDLDFVDRWFEFRKAFRYASPEVVCMTYPDIQKYHSLYMQVLTFKDGKYRHEFLFQNGVLIIEADDFMCFEYPADEVSEGPFERTRTVSIPSESK